LKYFYKYDAVSGEILSTGVCQNTTLFLQAAGEPGKMVMGGAANPKTQYMQLGRLVPRPELNVAINKEEILSDGSDELSIKGLPKGTVCTVISPHGHDDITIDDDSLEFATEEPGKYEFRFKKFPYIEKKVIFNAV
jgi:hypothetical protein